MMNTRYFKHTRRCWYSLWAMILLAGACQKHVSVADNPDSRISFFNASEYLHNQIQNSSGRSYLLIDVQDTAHSSLSWQTAPSFNGGQYQFPISFYYTKQTQPWISYMRIHPGQHTVILTDTGGHHLLDTTVLATDPSSPRSIYYADSLGKLQSWVLADSTVPSAGTVRLRLFDLSPDAGKIFFTIGGKPATGFPDSLQYGQITAFTPWTNPVADTLQIRFFHVRDSVDVLTSASLSVTPGHAYNVVLTGYLNSHFFRDPYTGRFLSFNPDLKVLLTQNY